MLPLEPITLSFAVLSLFAPCVIIAGCFIGAAIDGLVSFLRSHRYDA